MRRKRISHRSVPFCAARSPVCPPACLAGCQVSERGPPGQASNHAPSKTASPRRARTAARRERCLFPRLQEEAARLLDRLQAVREQEQELERREAELDRRLRSEEQVQPRAMHAGTCHEMKRCLVLTLVGDPIRRCARNGQPGAACPNPMKCVGKSRGARALSPLLAL
jgi:hypothetical protein